MARYVMVDGEPCKVISTLGYNPDIGARAIEVERVCGEHRMAVSSANRGLYRFWTARDRLQWGPSRVVGQDSVNAG
jgi:hypothetical protein